MGNQEKRIVNMVCVFCLLFHLTAFIPIKLFQYLRIDSQILISVLWMIIMNLLPIIFICKNMILKFDTTKRKTNILRVSIVLLIVYFGVLYRLIGYVAVQIPLLKSFLINNPNIKLTTLDAFSYAILGPIVEEIIYRGILLEQLRTIDKSRLISYLGKLKDNQLQKIDNALIKTLSINIIGYLFSLGIGEYNEKKNERIYSDYYFKETKTRDSIKSNKQKRSKRNGH